VENKHSGFMTTSDQRQLGQPQPQLFISLLFGSRGLNIQFGCL